VSLVDEEDAWRERALKMIKEVVKKKADNIG